MANTAELGIAPGAVRSARGGLAALSLAMLLASLGTSIANVALPALGDTFDASLAQVKWVVLSYLLAVTAGVVFAGRLGDRFGRRRLLLAGLALFGLSSILCAAAPALWMLVLARVGQGAGAAAMMALTMAMAVEAPGKSGSALGLLAAISAAGTALGPAVGGALIALVGWRALFILCAVGAGTTLVLARISLHAASVPAAKPGQAAFTGTRLLLRDPLLATSLAAGPLVSAVVMAALVVGPFYLTYGLGQDAARVGLILSSGPIVAALAGVPAGRLTDRFGAFTVAAGGLGLMTLGCAALALLPRASGIAGYVLPIAVTTLGYGLFQTGNNSLVLLRAPGDRRGLVSGLLTLLRNAGLIGGASVGAAIFAYALAGEAPASASPDSVAAAMRTTFAAAAASVALAFTLLWSGQMLMSGWMPDEDSNLD
ncbi:MAG TPA: MFS transporter [Allosphingosinicella sp.]